MMDTKKEIADAKKLVELRERGVPSVQAIQAVYGLDHIKYCGDPKRKQEERCKVDVVVLEMSGLVEDVRAFGLPGGSDRLARKLKKEHADEIKSEESTVHNMQMIVE